MSLDVLNRWRILLGELGELGGALCSSIEADDVLGAVAAMMQLPGCAATATSSRPWPRCRC